MKGKAGVQNSNNAYMLVYMLRDTLKEVRMSEAEEKRKRETLVKASRIPEAIAKQVSNGGEPEEKKRKVRSIIQNIWYQIGSHGGVLNKGRKKEEKERREMKGKEREREVTTKERERKWKRMRKEYLNANYEQKSGAKRRGNKPVLHTFC